jgi:type II secretory pathway component PulJ
VTGPPDSRPGGAPAREVLDAERHPLRAQPVGHLRLRPPARPEVDRRLAEVDDDHVRLGIGLDVLRLLQRVQDDRARPLDVVAVADADVVLPAPLRIRGVHRDGVREQLPVRDDHAPPVVGLDRRRARLDVLDRALVVLEADLVAHAERAGDEDEDAREEVLEDVPEGEADRHAPDAERADEVRRREAREGHRRRDQHPHEEDARLREPPDRQLERLVVLAAPLRVAADASPHEARDQPEDGDDDDREQDARQRGDEAVEHPLHRLPGLGDSPSPLARGRRMPVDQPPAWRRASYPRMAVIPYGRPFGVPRTTVMLPSVLSSAASTLASVASPSLRATDRTSPS